jgi:serine/threonine protein kinase
MACDVWAMGVMLYMILSGEPPFNGDNEKEILANAAMGRFHFDEYVVACDAPSQTKLASVR